MTLDPNAGNVPEFDLPDRLHKTLRHAGVGVQEMADYLGVSRNTVSAWINGRSAAGLAYLRLWALRTGVPLTWLQTGESPRPGNPDGGSRVVRPKGLEPPTFCSGVWQDVTDVEELALAS